MLTPQVLTKNSTHRIPTYSIVRLQHLPLCGYWTGVSMISDRAGFTRSPFWEIQWAMTTRSQGLSHWSAETDGTRSRPGHHGKTPIHSTHLPGNRDTSCSAASRRASAARRGNINPPEKKTPLAILLVTFLGRLSDPFQRFFATSTIRGWKIFSTWITWTLFPTNLSRLSILFGRSGDVWLILMETGFCSQGPGFPTDWWEINVRPFSRKTMFRQTCFETIETYYLQWSLHFTANRKLQLPTWNIEFLLRLLKVSSYESSPDSDCWPLMFENKIPDRVMTLLSKAPSSVNFSGTSSNGTCRRANHVMNLELLGLEMSCESSMQKKAQIETVFKMGPQKWWFNKNVSSISKLLGCFEVPTNIQTFCME